MISTRRLAVVLAVVAAPIGRTSGADDTPVDLELVLAVDVSGSMDESERALQRGGYVEAFLHPEVIAPSPAASMAALP